MSLQKLRTPSLLALVVCFAALFCGAGFPVSEKTPEPFVVNENAVAFENVELRYYEDSGWPYLHNVFVNGTDRTITGRQYAMLAYDQNGKPLKLHWFFTDSSAQASYLNLVEDRDVIEPGERCDVVGGWSLYDEDKMVGWPKIGDGGPCQVAYALYCVKQLTFADGTVWNNPVYENWQQTYENQTVEPEVLKGYYPYQQTVE